jgi:hypothetical protein
MLLTSLHVSAISIFRLAYVTQIIMHPS